MNQKLELITPGDILSEEFLLPMKISQNKLSRDIDVPVSRVNNIIQGKAGITADMALRLSKYFGNSAEVWMNIQSHYSLEKAKNNKWEDISSRIIKLPFTQSSEQNSNKW